MNNKMMLLLSGPVTDNVPDGIYNRIYIKILSDHRGIENLGRFLL